MDEILITVGGVDMRLSLEAAERAALDLAAALYEARHGANA